MSDGAPAAVRLDRWLWAARFFRSRSLARQAIEGGHVHVNGDRVKPARNVRVGDRLEITRGSAQYGVEVLGLAERRGPARVAQALYAETDESLRRRDEQRRRQALERGSQAGPGARPSKKGRRELARLKRRT